MLFVSYPSTDKEDEEEQNEEKQNSKGKKHATRTFIGGKKIRL